ncbi:MAG: FAD-dependent oxidoreductase [Lactimicrobium sp.]|jgi:2,4-dienoyl-CoA reductase-like NADH-dependent reductase (Old Yellow Enzyme family)/thioredoxin reductase
MFDRLFEPMQIGSLQLKNRIIMTAMGTRFCKDRYVTDRLIAYHVARAKGGVALNTVEVSSVEASSAPSMFLSLDDDKYIEGHKKLVQAIHDAGGKACVQLWQGSIAVGMDPKARIFVVQDTPFTPTFTMPGITVDEIHMVEKAYGAAARRAVEAGYDCLEFHCAHNYLPHSFLSGGLNHRTDEYGGDLAHRAKFPLECIKEIRKNMPADMPLFMRIDAQDDFLPGGNTIEDQIAFAKTAKEAGVNVLNVSRGNVVTPAMMYEVPPLDLARGFNVDNAARIRRETGMITMAVGRINTPDLAEKVLEDDKADLVAMSRFVLCDPDAPNKAKEGRADEIKRCIGCDQGCLDGFADLAGFPEGITCMRNPMVGHETDWALKKAEKNKKVLIIGGGVGGMEAALVLKQRGMTPVLYEASDHLGGQFITAGKAPHKEEMEAAARDMAKRVERANIETHLNQKVDETFDFAPYDDVIIAAGASPITLGLPVPNAHEVLNGKKEVSGKVVVIGGGLVGLEAAEYIASRGNKVTVIEMQEKTGNGLGAARAACMNIRLQQLGIEQRTSTKFVRLTDKGLIVEHDGRQEEIVCDNVVVAIGAKANDTSAIVDTCKAENKPVQIIGDAVRARRALNAIHEGFATARTL